MIESNQLQVLFVTFTSPLCDFKSNQNKQQFISNELIKFS